MMYSEQIQAFLNFLRDSQMEYNIAVAEEKEANEETQDILHCIELQENEDLELACIARALRSVRVNRREAKDRERQLQPVVEWIDQNRKTINELERLLGAVRKVEKNIGSRLYVQRTNILDQVMRSSDTAPVGDGSPAITPAAPEETSHELLQQ